MTRRTLISILLLALSTAGCDDKSDDVMNTIMAPSDFNLKTDIFHFTSKLPELDTLKIYANLSACVSFRKEINTLTKRDEKMFMNGTITDESFDKYFKVLDWVEYDLSSSDSLNFEELFQYMQNKPMQDKQSKAPVFTIVYKQDTVKYFSEHLTDHLKNMDYYSQIKSRLYPDEEDYQPLVIPPGQ